MESINPREMQTDAELEALFPVNDNLLERIEQDMRDGTYDISQHIIMATWEGQDEPVVLDGHTRRLAAIKAGIDSVPIFLKEDFDTKEEAIRHAIKLQCNRRNLTDAELLRYVEILYQPEGTQRDPDSGRFTVAPDGATGKFAEAIAEDLNISTRKAERLITVKNHGDSETKGAVFNKELSVNQAYEKTQEKRRAAKAANQAKQNQPAPAPKAEAIEPDEPFQEPADASSGDVPSPNQEPEDEPSLDQEPEYDTVTRQVTFRLDLAEEIKSLGGFFDEHVNKAVEYYLDNLNEVNEALDDDGEEDYKEYAYDHEEDTEEDDYLNA